MSNDAGSALLEAVRGLAPQIRACADQIEREQRLPEPLLTAMVRIGLFKMLVPRELGGGEVEPETCVRVIEEVARSDGSTGWCVMLPATVGASAGTLGEDAAREMFQDQRSCVVSSGLLGGRATMVEGGYCASGRWAFTSGCRQATWIGGNCTIYDGGTPYLGPEGRPETRQLFFPATECEIIETWQVTGLRGSGSHDFTVTDLFVPRERSLVRSSPLHPRHPSPLYAFAVGAVPLTATGAGMSSAWAGFGAIGFGAVSLGIARGALDAFAELASVKAPRGGQALLRDDPLIQALVGRAEAALRSARAFLYETIREIWTTVCLAGVSTPEQQVVLRLTGAHAAAESARVVEMVWKAAGTSSIFLSSPLERRFRDVHVATQNIGVSPVLYGVAGRQFLEHSE